MNGIVKLGLVGTLVLGMAVGGYWLGARATRVTPAATVATQVEHKVLYYRNPMGLSDTSPVPKKDSMGMDYVAVYADDATAAGSKVLDISPDRVQKLGVKSEAVSWRELNAVLRVNGRVEINEQHTYTIAPKFEGWVDKLYVNTTGQAVAQGQPLFDVYSPELVSAQREHALATQGLIALKDADDDAKASMQSLADASAARLRNWDVGDAQKSPAHDASRVTFRAPVSGVVLEKKAVQGMRFMPGEVLYQIADLSALWVIADVPEQNIAQVKVGSRVQLTVDAYPDRHFDGKVDFIYPTLNSATRTVQVRMVVQNTQGLLKPAMYAIAQIDTGKGAQMLAVPNSAVIDSGTKQVVLVRLAEGRFEPRVIALGKRGDDYVEVLSGVAEGEQVVTSALFLIDSESNLKAALSDLGVSNAQAATPIGTPKSDALVPTPSKSKAVAHQARGKLNMINADGSVSITHQPIQSLGWPGMTMDFALANSALVAGIGPGSKISFEIVERAPDEWVITKMQVLGEGD